LASTILNGNTSPTISTSSAECILGKKRFNSDNIKVPNKKFKNIDKNAHSPKATLSEGKSLFFFYNRQSRGTFTCNVNFVINFKLIRLIKFLLQKLFLVLTKV